MGELAQLSTNTAYILRVKKVDWERLNTVIKPLIELHGIEISNPQGKEGYLEFTITYTVGKSKMPLGVFLSPTGKLVMSFTREKSKPDIINLNILKTKKNG